MVALHSALSPTSVDLSDPATLRLVRRIFYRRFSSRVIAAGIDPEDALQEILLGLLVRSRGRSAWDPARGGLSTWIYVAISGLTINLADKSRRGRRRGWTTGEEDDASVSPLSLAPSVYGARDLEDLATEMEIPLGVVAALADGEDVFSAALTAGCDFFEASSIASALGERV